MTTAKIQDRNQLTKYQRRQIALKAMTPAKKTVRDVNITRVMSYPTFVQVFYKEHGEPSSALIKKENLVAFLNGEPEILLRETSGDMTMGDYIEDNISLVCKAYLEAGKEVMS